MASIALAAKLDLFVVLGLNRSAPWKSPVHVLDVGRSAPTGHQSARRSATVFVRENHGVLQKAHAIFREPLAIDNQRNVRGFCNCVCSREQHWSIGDDVGGIFVKTGSQKLDARTADID